MNGAEILLERVVVRHIAARVAREEVLPIEVNRAAERLEALHGRRVVEGACRQELRIRSSTGGRGGAGGRGSARRLGEDWRGGERSRQAEESTGCPARHARMIRHAPHV